MNTTPLTKKEIKAAAKLKAIQLLEEKNALKALEKAEAKRKLKPFLVVLWCSLGSLFLVILFVSSIPSVPTEEWDNNVDKINSESLAILKTLHWEQDKYGRYILKEAAMREIPSVWLKSFDENETQKMKAEPYITFDNAADLYPDEWKRYLERKREALQEGNKDIEVREEKRLNEIEKKVNKIAQRLGLTQYQSRVRDTRK